MYDNTSKIFYPYTTSTAYINPYSSDRQGGELITEYNQRNSLNTLCKKEMQFQEYATALEAELNDTFGDDQVVDETTGEIQKISAGLYSFVKTKYAMLEYWKATVLATGVQDEHDFDLECTSDELRVKRGKALIMGYNVESLTEIQLDMNDVLTNRDVQDVESPSHHQASDPIVTKFVKLAVMYVTDGAHDERLNPPLDEVYKSVAVVVDDEMPMENELLLGTITRSKSGKLLVTQNPVKTRLLPLDVVAGAEGYDELINTANMEDGHIYGLKKDAEHHITDITTKIWLDTGSNIAKLLKGLSAQPETATVDYHKNTRALIATRSINGSDGSVEDALRSSGGTYPAINWTQIYALEEDANATVEHRSIYYPFAYCDDEVIIKTELPRPSDTASKQYVYTDPKFPEIHGRKGNGGFMTGQQAFMLEKAYAHAAYPEDVGTQYGPFMSVAEAASWFAGHPEKEYKEKDYFWVINDTIDGVLASYGTVSGTVSGNVAGVVTGTVAGSVTVTGEVTGEVEGSTVESDPKPITGTLVNSTLTNSTATLASTVVTGNVSGNATGLVSGQLDSFAQNVSARYVCVYSGQQEPGLNKGVHCIAHKLEYGTDGQPPTTVGDDYIIVPGNGEAWFVVQAVERGFGVPATAETFGLVKAALEGESTPTTLLDVITNKTTGRLNVNQLLYELILNGGYETDTRADINLYPGGSTEALSHKKYTSSSVTIHLLGKLTEWEALDDTAKTLKNVRGHVILDYTELAKNETEYNDYAGGIIFNMEDVDYVTLAGNNLVTGTNLPTRPFKFGFDHCIVDTPFFENIGKWHASSFTSGSNTIELNNPWMTVDKIFSENEYIKNKLYTRFSSVTMGENGVSSAMMDMWIQYENTQPDNKSVDYCWKSRLRVNFPPLMCEFESTAEGSVTTGNINLSTIQYIPSDLSMKIGATAGVHEVITAQNEASQVYTPSGNLLATVDWSYNTHYDVSNAPSEQLYLNLYMKNSSGEPMQKISNLKFRVPVQVTRMSDNSSVWYASYEAMYQTEPEVVT